jgi:hypothetical protein
VKILVEREDGLRRPRLAFEYPLVQPKRRRCLRIKIIFFYESGRPAQPEAREPSEVANERQAAKTGYDSMPETAANRASAGGSSS